MSTEVTRSLKEIDAEVVKLDKNVKKLTDQNKNLDKSLKLDPTNTTLLTQKTNNLKDAVNLATQKVNTLKTAQKQMQEEVKNGNKTEEEYRKITIEVGKAEAQVKSLNAQVKQTANQSLAKLENSAKAVGRAATVALTGIVALGTAYAITGDKIAKATDKYNISAERFQKNAHIYDKTTGNADGYATALENVQKQLTALAKGSTKAIDAFAAIGINAEEISKLSAADALDLITQKLSGIADEDERVTMASMLLSSAGYEVAQVAGLTASEISELNTKLAEAGILTQAEADQAAELNDKFTDAQNASKKMSAELAVSLMPVLETLLEMLRWLIDVLSFIVKIFNAIPKPIQVILTFVLVFLVILPKLIAIIKAVNVVMTALGANPINLKILLICTAVALLIMLLFKLAELLAKAFGKKIDLGFNVNGLGNQVADATASANASSGSSTSSTTTNYYDYSTQNNTIEYETDIDDIADKLSTKIKVGGK